MTLEQLRSRLAAIDRQIVDLIAERQTVSNEIGAVKRAEGRATRDFSREKQVIDAARVRAAEQGVSPGVAEALMQLLIRTSLTTQERARVRAEGAGQGQRAMVIGGSGKMGRWFADFLDSQGFDVTVADPAGPVAGFKHAADWRALREEFAVTVVATPLAVAGGILEALGARGHRGLIFDIGSLKAPLMAAKDFDPSDMVEFWDVTNRQDWKLCEGAQLGALSRGYRPGPYQPSEDCVHTFDRWYADRIAPLL